MARRRQPHGATELDVRSAYAAHGPELYRFALRQLGDGGAADHLAPGARERMEALGDELGAATREADAA